jgi:hypothetical protein
MLVGRAARCKEQIFLETGVAGWVDRTPRKSRTDEKKHHEGAIRRPRTGYERLQSRIDEMYSDKFDGRIDAAFFARKSAQCRSEQDHRIRTIEERQSASQAFLEKGVQVLELPRDAHGRLPKP